MSAGPSTSSAPKTSPTNPSQPSAPSNSSALKRAKVNLAYLALGSKASIAPASLTTRSTLTTIRCVINFHPLNPVLLRDGLGVGADGVDM